MSKITCNVITDVLELYADGVVSEDTRQLVEEHLPECPPCSEKLELIKQSVAIPAQTEASPIKGIRKRIKKKNIIISAISFLIIVAILPFAYYFLAYSVMPVPYERANIVSAEVINGEIMIYHKNDTPFYYLSSNFIDEKTVEVYVCFNETFISRFSPKNTDVVNNYLGIPVYGSFNWSNIGFYSSISLHDIEPSIEYECVRVYYCAFKESHYKKVKGNYWDNNSIKKHLIWEKQG